MRFKKTTENMKPLILGVFGLSVVLISCKNSNQSYNSKQDDFVIDTLNSVRFGNDWVTPKTTFDFNSFIDFQGDTLRIVTCAEFVYSPFGLIQNRTGLKSSKLKHFVCIDIIEQMGNREFEFQKLSLDSNRLILFFDNDPESSKGSYVFKGEIFDNRVNFDNKVRIGMTKKEFIGAFFTYFPENVMNKYNTIIFESCVQAVRHTYSFKNNSLESVKFDSDSYWTVDYD
jgi:hypothetical protein